MFKGQNSHSKLEIIIFIILKLLAEGKCESNYIKTKFNISNLTLIRYIAEIRNSLYDLGIYYIEILYSKQYNAYICVNSKSFS